MWTVATDGSSFGNPGPSGWAWYADQTHWRAGGWPKATNNRGELMALLDLLEATREEPEEILILLDSKYVLDAVTKWRFSWKKQGWTRGKKRLPVVNKDLMIALDRALAPGARAGQVRFEWVKGHAGHELNEQADQLATKMSGIFQAGQTPSAEETGPGWNGQGSDLDFPGAEAPVNSPADATSEATSLASASDETVFAETEQTEQNRQCQSDSGQIAISAGESIGKVRYSTIPRPARRVGNYLVKDHYLEVPLAHPELELPATLDRRLRAEQISIFFTEISHTEYTDLPYLIYFQGGPGCPGSRTTDWSSGWMGEILKHFRLIMLDQRGTGRSAPLDNVTIPAYGGQAYDRLRLMRADQIVADAEAIRTFLGIKQWTVMGQSYGGFIITAYLSRYPESIKQAFITGGLPGLTDIDEIYQATYQATAARCEQWYEQQSDAEQKVRFVADLCRHTKITLPTGEILTPTRLRSLGMNLGRTLGLETLWNIFEFPLVGLQTKEDEGSVVRQTCVQDFLGQVNEQISFARNPLYGLLHETIYAQAVPGAGATCWGADRLREEISGFGQQADPNQRDLPYYLTGEHFGRWVYQSDPAMKKFAGLAERLAEETDWPVLYDPQMLAKQSVPVYAMVYHDDIFVPRELSLQTAKVLGAEVEVSHEYHHDGLRASGTKVIRQLLSKAGIKDPA